MFNFATFVRYLAICGFCGCRILPNSADLWGTTGVAQSSSTTLVAITAMVGTAVAVRIALASVVCCGFSAQRVRKRESPTQEVIESHCLISGIVFWCFLRAFFHKVDMIIPFLAICQLCVAVSFQGARFSASNRHRFPKSQSFGKHELLSIPARNMTFSSSFWHVLNFEIIWNHALNVLGFDIEGVLPFACRICSWSHGHAVIWSGLCPSRAFFVAVSLRRMESVRKHWLRYAPQTPTRLSVQNWTDDHTGDTFTKPARCCGTVTFCRLRWKAWPSQGQNAAWKFIGQGIYTACHISIWAAFKTLTVCRELYLGLNWVAPAKAKIHQPVWTWLILHHMTLHLVNDAIGLRHALPRLRLVLQCDLRSEIGHIRIMTCYDSITNKRCQLHGHVGTSWLVTYCLDQWMKGLLACGCRIGIEQLSAEGFSALNLKITFVHVLLGLGRTYPWHLFVGNPKIVGYPGNASFWKCLLQTRIRLESSGV
jgi:hypothetical protein